MVKDKRGRPTDYKPEYSELLIEFMKRGYSFDVFAREISVAKQTLYNWVERYPEFMNAKNVGVSHFKEVSNLFNLEKAMVKDKRYKPEYCELILKMMSKGKTVKDFAKKVGVSEHTISKWAKEHPEFMEAKDMGHYKSRMFNRQRV